MTCAGDRRSYTSKLERGVARNVFLRPHFLHQACLPTVGEGIITVRLMYEPMGTRIGKVVMFMTVRLGRIT